MRLLNHSEIWSVYSMSKAISDIAEAFAVTSTKNPLLPLRTRLNLDSKRTVLVMPAGTVSSSEPDSATNSPSSNSDLVEGVAVKTIALYPGNYEHNLPTAPASLLLLDAETGMAKALFDGDTVTKIRTGASSGVAFKYLADPKTKIGVLIGTGGQAATQALAMITALPDLEELRIVNPQQELAEDFALFLSQWKPFTQANTKVKLTVFSDSDQAALGAKAIILVTSSTKPVLSAKNLEPGCVISCVGSYQPHMQECGSDIIAAADLIVCDQVKAAVEESGDLIIPLREGIITSDDLQVEIGQIVTGQAPGRTSPEQIIVYETVGVGTQDLWAAQAILTAAETANIGIEWNPLE